MDLKNNDYGERYNPCKYWDKCEDIKTPLCISHPDCCSKFKTLEDFCKEVEEE